MRAEPPSPLHDPLAVCSSHIAPGLLCAGSWFFSSDSNSIWLCSRRDGSHTSCLTGSCTCKVAGNASPTGGPSDHQGLDVSKLWRTEEVQPAKDKPGGACVFYVTTIESILTSPSSASGHSSERAIGPRSTGPLQDLYTSPEAGRKDQGHISAQKKALNLNLYVFLVNYFYFCVPLDRYISCSGSGLLKLLLILLFLTVPKYSLDKTNCFGIWASGNTVSKTGLLGLTAFACMSTENF